MPEYADISNKFDLGSAEWDALEAFSDILRVSNQAFACTSYLLSSDTPCFPADSIWREDTHPWDGTSSF